MCDSLSASLYMLEGVNWEKKKKTRLESTVSCDQVEVATPIRQAAVGPVESEASRGLRKSTRGWSSCGNTTSTSLSCVTSRQGLSVKLVGLDNASAGLTVKTKLYRIPFFESTPKRRAEQCPSTSLSPITSRQGLSVNLRRLDVTSAGCAIKKKLYRVPFFGSTPKPGARQCPSASLSPIASRLSIKFVRRDDGFAELAATTT